MRVLFLDECHLLWGDISGYGWSRRQQRVDVEIKSTKQRQTYYGALDYLTKQFVVKEYSAGNEDNTVAFLQYLQSLYPKDTRLVIVWDGVSYHRSKVMQEFLGQTNRGLSAEAWKITCIRLAPNAPEQNPVEDVWLQAKQFIRKYARLCKRFGSVKFLFQLVTHCQTFAFAKAFMYGYCSSPI
ncbi:MAG TPA: IS630 family transposase [Trichocoleus sp.]